LGVLQVTADRPGAGKTSLVGALLAQLAGAGQKTGYFKPFSPTPDDDPDVAFISQYLLAPTDGPQVPAPQPMPEASGPVLAEAPAQAIQASAGELAAAAEVVLVEGPDSVSPGGSAWSLPSELASLLDCRTLIIIRYSTGLDPATVTAAAEPFAGRLAGVIINGVIEYHKREVDQGLLPELRSRGVPVLGALPEDRGMLAVTVQQIAEHLGGHWVQDPVNTDAYVERFLIGGNIMDSGPTYFGRFANQAVITRAERPDIQMACLMEDTRCLILTGGTDPSAYVKAEALERDVPLILVEEGTLSTAEALGGLLELATPYSPWKIERFGQLIHQNLDMAALTSALT